MIVTYAQILYAAIPIYTEHGRYTLRSTINHSKGNSATAERNKRQADRFACELRGIEKIVRAYDPSKDLYADLAEFTKDDPTYMKMIDDELKNM